MPYYSVRAIDVSGKEVSRSLEADNEVQLLSFLEFLNLTPVKISRKPDFIGKLLKALHLRKIKRKELIDLFENLHLLSRSGVPFGTGLWDLSEDMDNPALREMLQEIAYRIQSGISISSAMARYERVFGSIAVNLIRIGEESGNLDKVFKDISDHYARIEDFLSKVKQALIYPAFALVMITGALLFWMVFVLPKLADLFKGLNLQLPTITLVVLNVSSFLSAYFPALFLGFFVFALLIFLLRKKSERFRYITDRSLLKIPIIGMILNTFNFAFFSEYMRLMISAGVPIHEALSVMEHSFTNRAFKRAMSLIGEHVSTGGSVSSGMRETRLFPALMVRMVAVGEETGGLDDQLNYLATYYYNRLDYITQNIAKIIEPVVIIIVGLFMAVVMVSLLLPIYDIITQVGTRF
ncbi:MAG TPA: type II secretion system F family protein [Aquifex aeolicus]|nr:type II secretion system F family protein [Aquifex aeolicus]